MANNETRKTGVYGMKDLPKLKRKSGPLPPTRGFQQLGEKRTTGRDGLKRLKTIIEDELTDEDAFMDPLMEDNTPGISGQRLEEDDDSAEDEPENDDGSGSEDDEAYEDDEDDSESASEAEEKDGSSESEDGSDVEEKEVERLVKQDGLKGRKKAYRYLEQSTDRIKADNNFVADFDDEALNDHIVDFRDRDIGRFELQPLEEGQDALPGQTVELRKLDNGKFYDKATKKIYEPTNYVNSKTQKVAKTVRRHVRGAPTGHTVKVRKPTKAEKEAIRSQEATEGDVDDA